MPYKSYFKGPMCQENVKEIFFEKKMADFMDGTVQRGMEEARWRKNKRAEMTMKAVTSALLI